jgi:hypothetical protein
MNIRILDYFLKQDECDFMIKFYNKNKNKAQKHYLQKTLLLDVIDPILKERVESVSKDMNNSILDWCGIAKWPTNSHQQFHLDTFSKDTILTSVCFLNDDFEGGELTFKEGTTFKPKKGRIVFFDGMYYIHGVKEITKGTRYTFAAWYKKINEYI